MHDHSNIKFPHNVLTESVFTKHGVKGTQNFPSEIRVYSVHRISHEQVIQF